MPVKNFIWDVVSDNVLMEIDDEGNTLARYVQTPDLYGEAISQERDGETRYYNYDGLGNTVELTDENQNVTDTYEYSAFGEEIARTGTTENPFGYKGALGYYATPETGDYYVRERTYEPASGRWLALDTLGFLDGPNRYVYVRNSPINRFDPNGMQSQSVPFRQQFPPIEIPFPDVPPLPSDPGFGFPECLWKEFECSDFNWVPSLCPACTCDQTKTNVGIIKSDCANDLKARVQAIIDAHKATCPNIIIGAIKCDTQCVSGIPGMGITCPKPLPNGKTRIDICIATKQSKRDSLSKCTLGPLIEHELVHVRQILAHVCGGGSDPMSDRRGSERTAYEVQCRLLGQEQCFRGQTLENFVNGCVEEFLDQSVGGGNPQRIGEACRRLGP